MELSNSNTDHREQQTLTVTDGEREEKANSRFCSLVCW